MKKCIYIGMFGAIGAIIRTYIEQLELISFQGVAINTLLINSIGSFFIALIYTDDKRILKLNDKLKIGITTGFLGGFTTFSTLCKEASLMIYDNRYIDMVIYIVISAILGVISAFVGEVLMEYINKMNVRRIISATSIFEENTRAYDEEEEEEA